MATKVTLTARKNGKPEENPLLVIRIEGWFDIMRFLPNMLKMQTDFSSHGEEMLCRIKRRWGAEKFEQNVNTMWGNPEWLPRIKSRQSNWAPWAARRRG